MIVLNLFYIGGLLRCRPSSLVVRYCQHSPNVRGRDDGGRARDGGHDERAHECGGRAVRVGWWYKQTELRQVR